MSFLVFVSCVFVFFVGFQKCSGDQSSNNGKYCFSSHPIYHKSQTITESCVIIGNTEDLRHLVSRFGLGNEIDLSHGCTFGGKETTTTFTTMMEKSFNHNVTQVVDDTDTCFASKYNIKHAFLEQFPTADAKFLLPTTIRKQIGYITENYLGKAINQVSELMRSDAELSVEWNPGTSLLPHVTNKTIPFEKYAYANPFHGVEDMAVFMHASYALFKGNQYGVPTNITELLPQILDRAMLMRSALEYLHTASAGRFFEDSTSPPSLRDLMEKVYYDAYILEIMYINKADIFLTCNMATDSVHSFNLMCRDLFKTPSRTSVPLVTLNQPDPSGKTEILMYGGYVYSPARFLSESLLALITAHITAQRNAPYVIQYLQGNGFKNVTVERRTCEFNGKPNVWMVHAVKI